MTFKSKELEEYIPEIEASYNKKHSGRKLQWHHQMGNGTITFKNKAGQFDLEGKSVDFS